MTETPPLGTKTATFHPPQPTTQTKETFRSPPAKLGRLLRYYRRYGGTGSGPFSHTDTPDGSLHPNTEEGRWWSLETSKTDP